MRCEEAREMMPAYAGDPGATLSFKRHLAGCSACRSELARYQGMLEGLHGMQNKSIEPPAELLGRLTAIPADNTALDRVIAHLDRNKKAYAGAAIVAVGAAGAALLKNRSRGLATA